MRDDSTHQDDSKMKSFLDLQLQGGQDLVWDQRHLGESEQAGWKRSRMEGKTGQRIQIDGLRKRDDSMHQMKTPT
ncbi:uncharacterized protein LOC144007305 isoform X3 [Festucalex cinctus]